MGRGKFVKLVDCNFTIAQYLFPDLEWYNNVVIIVLLKMLSCNGIMRLSFETLREYLTAF